MLLCMLSLFSCLGLNLFLWKDTAWGEKLEEKKTSGKWSERWNPPEGVQCFPVRYTALTERMVSFWSSRLGSIQYCSHCCYCQFSKVGGITTSTGENNTLCFIAALWVCAAKKKQKKHEMWITPHRELVKGGTSGKNAKKKKDKEKQSNIVAYCLQYNGCWGWKSECRQLIPNVERCSGWGKSQCMYKDMQ